MLSFTLLVVTNLLFHYDPKDYDYKATLDLEQLNNT